MSSINDMIQVVVFFLSNSVIYQHSRVAPRASTLYALSCSKEVIVADDLSVSLLLLSAATGCRHGVCRVVLLLEQELLLLLQL